MIGVAIVFAVLREAELVNYAAPPALLAAAALLVLAWRRWETGVQALLVVVVVEGAIRKWFLPSYAELVYFYKDVLMVAVLGGYLMQRRKAPFVAGRQLKVFFVALAAFVIYAVAVVVNPSAPHLVASLFGLKAYCLYMPLVFLVPRMFTTREKLAGFLRWYLVIALMVAALGVWQFMDGSQDSALNRYAWSEEARGGAPQDTALFADSEGTYYVRITSTFSFVTGLTVYLPVVFALLLGLTSLGSARALPRAVRLLYYATMGAVAATAFMTGSRSVIVGLALVAVVFYAFTSLKDAMRRLRQLAVGGALILLTLASVAPHAVDALYQRAFGGEEQIEEGRARVMEVFNLPLKEAEYAGAFGYGIGATQNSVPALMARLGLARTGETIPVAVESEAARVMLELGVVGFLLFTLLRLSMLVTLWRACVAIRDRETKALAVACFAALVFPLVAGGAVVNHTQNVYQWFLVGTVFALLNCEMQHAKLRRKNGGGEPLLNVASA
ncbi:MAG TPA: hypothetical protein VD861_20880 [Pyrinomonadaceae bacterium]|nr:hypothetical protein [Pyrinomonadaceae bacterium]